MTRSREVSPVTSLHVSGRNLLLVLCFCLFLYPISIDGVSVNYSFVLLPLIVALLSGKARKPQDVDLLFIVFYVLVFIVSSLYQYQMLDDWPRRGMSFLVFMSIFSFMIIKIDDQMVEAFKTAIIVVSVFFSLYAVAVLLSGAEILDPELAKNIVGSQRIGFMHIMAFWLLCFASYRFVWQRIVKYLATLVVIIGLGLTFSRASIVSLLASIVFFVVFRSKFKTRFSIRKVVHNTTIIGLAVVLVAALLQTVFPIVRDFFDARLIGFVSDLEAVENNLADPYTSEGTRIYIWGNILDYVLRNPLTGSGYLGVWILDIFNYASGSAHSQYFDVLFRVGFLGFVIYMFLLYRTGKCLRAWHPGLFYGFVGVLVYGVFHETFKESQGGFMLAFLIGMVSQMPLRRHAVAKLRSPGVGVSGSVGVQTVQAK